MARMTSDWAGALSEAFPSCTKQHSYDRTQTGKSCHCHCIVLHCYDIPLSFQQYRHAWHEQHSCFSHCHTRGRAAADKPEAIEDGHETHGSATDINIPTASANSNLRGLWEGLRNNNKWKFVRVCDCGRSIDAVEVKDEARIIICGWKGCETLWVSVFGIISVSLLTDRKSVV